MLGLRRASCQAMGASIHCKARERNRFAILISLIFEQIFWQLFIYWCVHRMSNVYRPGIWIFKIGNLRSGNIIAPDIDGERSLDRQESDTCSTARLPCPPTANCIDYNNGFCCSCADGYFGNGRECLMNSKNTFTLWIENSNINTLCAKKKLVSIVRF